MQFFLNLDPQLVEYTNMHIWNLWIPVADSMFVTFSCGLLKALLILNIVIEMNQQQSNNVRYNEEI
jgi:hypothetical protein